MDSPQIAPTTSSNAETPIKTTPATSSSASVLDVASPATMTAQPTTPLRSLSKQSLKNSPIEFQNDQKRRSSSRSIKRKRFDDEIVEYSLTIQQSRNTNDINRASRPRAPPQIISPTNAPVIAQSPVAPAATPEPHQPLSSVVEAVPAAPVVAPVPQVAPPSPAPVSATLPAPVQEPPTPIPPTIPVVNTLPPSSPVVPMVMDRTPATERRPRPIRQVNNKRPRRNNRSVGNVPRKDLGRWKPVDDLALIIGVQQTNDLRMIHRGVKFSCKFTLQDLQHRWYALLYDPSVSRIAIAAMRNLHPEVVEAVQRKALYSVQEEELLGTIKSTETPKLEQFQELLNKNAALFYCARTPKSLHNHWLLLKQYSLLPDQSVKPLLESDQPISFSDAEDLLFENDSHEQPDEALEMELTLADRRNKHAIRLLEGELSRWGVLVDSVVGPTAATEFDNQTLACLCGRLVRYLMRSKEITFGRDAKDCLVDVDLSLEGPAAKISRRQGTIKLRSNGDFFIANEGKRAIFIDGLPLLSGCKTRLAHNCTVEISGLRFSFLVNYELINAIRQESAKTSNPLN